MSGDGTFPPTMWSLARAGANRPTDSGGKQRRDDLIERYARPIAATVRRMAFHYGAAHDAAGARELADGFREYLLTHDVLARADPTQGRFRCVIQGVARDYVRSEPTHRTPASSDVEPVPDEPDDPTELDEERAWVHGLVADVIDALEQQHGDVHSVFVRSHGLDETGRPASRQELVRALGISADTVTSQLQRATEFVRDALRAAIIETTADQGSAESEWADLEPRFHEITQTALR